MKYALTLFIILFMIATGAAYYFWSLSRDQDQTALRVKTERDLMVDSLKQNVATRDNAVLKLRKKMSVDSLKNRVAQSGLKIEIKTMRAKERRSRTDTVEITLVDSIFMADDSLILKLETERNGIQRDCKTLVDSLLANAMDFRGIIDIKDLQNTALQKEVTKEKKRGRIFKWLFYAAAAGLIFESVKD